MKAKSSIILKSQTTWWQAVRGQEIVELDHTTKTYSLLGFETFTEEQKRTLIELGQKRLDAFIEPGRVVLILASELS